MEPTQPNSSDPRGFAPPTGYVEPPLYYGQGQTPHRCPVCVGKGIVPNGFYLRTSDVMEYTTSDATPETCRACSGTGLLWR